MVAGFDGFQGTPFSVKEPLARMRSPPQLNASVRSSKPHDGSTWKYDSAGH
jgi:hypothetical protein